MCLTGMVVLVIYYSMRFSGAAESAGRTASTEVGSNTDLRIHCDDLPSPDWQTPGIKDRKVSGSHHHEYTRLRVCPSRAVFPAQRAYAFTA
jgi:hypothetical protein